MNKFLPKQLAGEIRSRNDFSRAIVIMSGDNLMDPTAHVPSDHVAQEASERLELALEAGAILGTWVWDIPNDRVTADERFARSFGLSATLCQQGLTLDQVTQSIHPQDVVRVEQAIAEAMRCEGAFRCEYRVLQADGVYRWIEANGRTEFDEEGRPKRFPGVLLNIEARRAAETERDRVTDLLRTFTEAVPGVVYAKDRQGRMLVANQGTTKLIGKSPEFYLGKTDLEYLEDKAQALVLMETDRRIMESGIPEQVEEHVRLADGSPAIWLSVKTPFVNDAGEVIGIIGSSIDVTARKEAEAAVKDLNLTLEHRIQIAVREREQIEKTLHHSQKIEAVGQLTGGIAHDFNNLLASISGSLELMQTRLCQGRIADVEKYIAVAQGAVTRAASLTHRLLAFSRRQTLSPQPTEVNALIAGMEELIARAMGPAVEIQIYAAAELWPTVIDQAQLENSLLNLCINARDAMPDGGQIVIRTANVSLERNSALDHELAPGDYLSISVSDTGIGMTPTVVSKAIEPFFTTKPLGSGTGLGLSMVYGFARQSGGDINIRSEEGRGTTVCLYLPRREISLDPIVEAVRSRDLLPGGCGTVLIVDDEPSIRMLVAELLGSLGYSVLEAGDGATGLELLQSDMDIDLLVSDIGLPGAMNGRRMADIAREGRSGLPILFITGYAENSIFEIAHLEYRTEVLTKPFSLEALAARVKALIESSK